MDINTILATYGNAILAIIFITVMSAIILYHRKKIVLQKIFFPALYFVMIRTKLGLKLMDWFAKHFRRPLKWLGYLGVVVGFLGMGFISYELIKSTLMLFLAPGGAPGIQPVLPFQAKGVFYVPFVYWIVSIFLIAVVHEMSHGIIARVHKMKVRSSGFAFLGIFVPVIPAAFVEPDEKHLNKRPARQQLAVFAAGPFSNVIFAALIIFLFAFPVLVPHSVTKYTAIWDMTDLRNEIVQIDGLKISQIHPGSPANEQGLPLNIIIKEINDISIQETEKLSGILSDLKPGETVKLSTSDKDYELKLGPNPNDATRGYIGISFETLTKISDSAIVKYGKTGSNLILYFSSLLFWLILLNLGIGLFNLLPLGPIDGGRMYDLALKKMINKKLGHKIWKYTSYFFLALIIINLTIGFVR